MLRIHCEVLWCSSECNYGGNTSWLQYTLIHKSIPWILWTPYPNGCLAVHSVTVLRIVLPYTSWLVNRLSCSLRMQADWTDNLRVALAYYWNDIGIWIKVNMDSVLNLPVLEKIVKKISSDELKVKNPHRGMKRRLYVITVMSHECHSILNHWYLECLINSLFKQWQRKEVSYKWNPWQMASNKENVSYHDIIMAYKHRLSALLQLHLHSHMALKDKSSLKMWQIHVICKTLAY